LYSSMEHASKRALNVGRKLKETRSPGIWVSLLLFLVPFLIRYGWALYFAPVPFLTPDELIYPLAGKAYVHSLVSWDLTGFAVNAEHPPLSKLFTALFICLLGPLGFSDIVALRVQSCLFSALTCVVAYQVGSKAGRTIGLLSWALLSFDPISIVFSIASLDVTSLFFASLAFKWFLEVNEKSVRPCLLSGVCLGAATLCKYTAWPIMLGTFALIMFLTRVSRRVFLVSLSVVAAVSLVLVILGNPLFWPPQVLGYSGYQVFLEATSVYKVGPEGSVVTMLDWIELAIKSWNKPLRLFYLSMFSDSLITYPFSIFSLSFLPWILLGSLIIRAGRLTDHSEFILKSLSWFLIGFLFFWFLAKSRGEPYYAVWLEPSAAIFSGYSLTRFWGRLKR